MKILRSLFYVVLLSAFLTSPALAAIPGKTEWSFGGTYVNPEDGKASWAFISDTYFPLTPNGIVVMGPVVRVSDNDNETALGLGIEMNIPGQKGGFAIGGQCIQFLDSEPGQDERSCVARGSVKLPITEHALFKPFIDIGLTGRARDADPSGGVVAVVKF